MIRGARGRLDRLAELKDRKNLRNETFELFLQMFKNISAFYKMDFNQKIKNRKHALEILKFLAGIFKRHSLIEVRWQSSRHSWRQNKRNGKTVSFFQPALGFLD